MFEILIEKVKEHQVLYNHRLSNYRDHQIRQATWEKIGRELNISANEAKLRWEKLRRSFWNAKSRKDESKYGMSCRKKSLWKYEKQMDFLTPFTESRNKFKDLIEFPPLNLKTESVDVMSEESNPDEVAPLQAHNDSTLTRPPVNFVHINMDAENERSAMDLENHRKPYETVKKLQNKKRKTTVAAAPAYKKLQILNNDSVLKRLKCDDTCTDTKRSKTTILLEAVDEMDMFFLSMSRITKQFSKVDKAKIKLELSNLVLSTEIKNQKLFLSSHPNNLQPTTVLLSDGGGGSTSSGID